jgi:hypothetical protein
MNWGGWARIPGMPLAHRQDALPPRRRDPFLLRGLKSLGVCAVITVVIAVLFDKSLPRLLAYTSSITLGCWFFIDSGRVLAARWRHRHAPAGTWGSREWPGWPAMCAILLLGTVLGYLCGNALGNLITGSQSPGFVLANPRQMLVVLLVSLVPGVAATSYFYNRQRVAAIEAQAQQAQREAAENQLRLLESQLEPHMLFNTLANLRVLIGMDPVRAQAMLDQLIGFLRATLNASRVGRHALSAEFSRLADYLALMQVRMGPRLQMRLDLPDALASVAVPPLLLQPLVENAIKHGLEPKVEGGRIEVLATREADQLVLTVRDTGVGLGAPASDGTRFGLQQVRDRLATLYGDAASFSLVAAGDGSDGCIATVRLPIDTRPP